MFSLNEYKNILDNTVIPISWDNDKQKKGYSEISNFILSNIPDEIYRFRSCNERSIEQFYNDQISFSIGSEMNDDFESRVYYDKQGLIDWLKQGYYKIKNADISEIKRDLLKISKQFNEKSNLLFAKKNIEQISEEYFINTLQSAVRLVSNNFDYWLEFTTNTIQNVNKFACFCSDITVQCN